ncbi:MAG: methyltransferase domain-containing protein [Candidatus Kariarchaeaceae archaeon]|jgi:SAM-dependent methyltransferase
MTEQTISSKKKTDEEVMKMVNQSYSGYAKKYSEEKAKGSTESMSCCDPVDTEETQSSDCCGSSEQVSTQSTIDLIQPNTIPTLGCDQDVKGGLLSIAKPQSGEVVVDLGSGPGKDTTNAAKLVGSEGRVIGIDFSDDMLQLAREHAIEEKIFNVDYRKGNLLELPVNDNMVDLVISNCVINLVPDKVQAFKEAYRILKSGGRIIESDMVGLVPLDEEIAFSDDDYCGCVGGAVSEERYVQHMKEAGFKSVEVRRLSEYTMKIAGKDVPYASSVFIAYKD